MRLINVMAQENLLIIEGEKGHQFLLILKARKHKQPSIESDPSNQVTVEDRYAEAQLVQRDFHEFYYSENRQNPEMRELTEK